MQQNLYQFVVSKNRENGFMHLLSNLKLSKDDIKVSIDKGGCYIYHLDIYTKDNSSALRKALNCYQPDFI